MSAPPAWLDDAPELRKLLGTFLDRLDRQPASARKNALALTLNDKTLPELFGPGEQADRLWDWLRSLAEDHGVLAIRPDDKRNPLDPEYLGARLRLRKGGEAILRAWLGRPAGRSPLQQWRKSVTAAGQFAGSVAKLAAHRIVLPGWSDAQVVAGFVCLGRQPGGLSLRQLSSRCFAGDSKFLDNREDLIRELYPERVIAPRPVMVSVFLPARIEGVLFIENQDSYLQAVSDELGTRHKFALVYAAGFRGSAGRIRQREGVSLHYHGASAMNGQAQLEAWWFGPDTAGWPCWFWGDLDYAGMGILKAFRQRFGNMQAWQPGYRPMLDRLQKGQGHAPAMTDKQAQTDPGSTGCDYADTVLLPLMRQHGMFVDQEGTQGVSDG